MAIIRQSPGSMIAVRSEYSGIGQVMTKAELKATLFDAYSSQLSGMPIYFEAEQIHDTYVCPICLRKFDRQALANGSLTLEHSIPEKLGKRYRQTAVLTCLDCNGIGGTMIDHHLMELIDSQDYFAGKSTDPQRIWTIVDGKRVRADMFITEVDGKKSFQAHFDREHSPPDRVDRALEQLKGVVDVPIAFDFSFPFIRSRILVAFARIGYLMMFRQFGYGYALRPNLDQIREQLLDPEADILQSLIVSNFSPPADKLNRVAVIDLPGDQQAFAVCVRLCRRDNLKRTVSDY